MPHEQNDNSRFTDRSTGSPFEAAADKAGMAMRDEIYGTGSVHMPGDGHNQLTANNNIANSDNSDGHNHGSLNATSLDKTGTVPAVSDGDSRGLNQVGVNGADKTVTPIVLDRSTLAGMLQNGALTYQQAIAISSPELASYLSSFRNNQANT